MEGDEDIFDEVISKHKKNTSVAVAIVAGGSYILGLVAGVIIGLVL